MTEKTIQNALTTGAPLMVVLGTTYQGAHCPAHGHEYVTLRGRFGSFVACPLYPACDIILNYGNDGVWRLTNQATRDARKRAHAAFDRLWRSGLMKRTQAYRALADALGLQGSECHIAHFDADTCSQVIKFAEALTP